MKWFACEYFYTLKNLEGDSLHVVAKSTIMRYKLAYCIRTMTDALRFYAQENFLPVTEIS